MAEAGPPARWVERFEFGPTRFDPQAGRVDLGWRLCGKDRVVSLTESFDFGPGAAVSGDRAVALERAVSLLHWIAGVSYWKAACTGQIVFSGSAPDAWQAEALDTVYRHGLAELAWQNGLTARYWPRFPANESSPASIPTAPPTPTSITALADRALVPMGGGKDSLVALERVRAAGIAADTVQVGAAPLIRRVAERAGTSHRVIGRRLDPELASLNADGAINGHVPITAINSAALVVAALLWDYRYVVFANERSADLPTLVDDQGRAVNHQWAKSLEFERLLDDWIGRYISGDLRVFSILRRERELAVVETFAGLERYHDVFSSCNRNFHLDGARTDRWCGECPKCLFVYLALAPFLDPQRLGTIFGRDLLADPALEDGFAALLALDGPRPFECVGEPDESRAAVRAIAGTGRWCHYPVVQRLASRLGGVHVAPLEELVRPSGESRIPSRFVTDAA